MLRDELKRIDGQRIAVLEEIRLRYCKKRTFIKDLLLLLGENDQDIQIGATWLLKRLAEERFEFRKDHLVALFSSLPELNNWLSKLHVCQMLQYLAIPKGSEKSVMWFLERNLHDENKFLRAWSYNGFYELAKQRKECIEYALERIELGDKDKVASVKARIRNIRKAIHKLQLVDS